MSDIAIRCEGLGKLYQLGVRERYSTLRESMVRRVKSWVGRGPHDEKPGSKSSLWALNDVSFEIKQGEVVGIIGRNGAGKSTLLKVLSRITTPSTGYADVFGSVGSLLEVGTGFHPELSGRENIYLNGAILGMSKSEVSKRFDEIVAFSEVEQFLDTPVKRYSSGMYMRLAFAVAAHIEPDILIVDEVLAVGDAAFQKKCLGKMGEVAHHGRTVLFVSHNLNAVTALCNRGICLAKGKVAAHGTVDDAIHTYVSSQRDAAAALIDSGIALRISMLDENGERFTTWTPSAKVVIRLDIHSDEPLRNPALDLAFYSEAGTKVFALKTDRMPASEIRGPVHDLSAELRIRNPGFAMSELSFDVGLRNSGNPAYRALWQRAETITVSASSLESYHVSDALIAPPVELSEFREGVA